MENKRIGNTLVIRWQIKVVTSQNLSEYELTLVRNEPNRKVNNIPFEIENGDTLVFKHEGMEQKVCGQYSYSLYVNFDKASQSVVDSCDGYYLSQRSCGEECDEECGTLNIENEINLKSVILMVEGVPGKSAYEIAVENGFKGTEEEWLESLKGIGVNIKGELKSEEELPQKGLPSDSYIIDGDLYVYVGENGNVEVNPKWSNVGTIRGPRGMSAYEIAVKKGFVGTEEEWLESLKGKDGKPFTYADLTPEQISELQKPATEAAKLANSAAQSANTSAENANQAALDANRAAQSAGTAASNASATNEAIQTAEGLRVQAENKRETAETQRKQNEQTRQQKETERQTAETERVKAEEARVTEFAALKKESETATTNANEAAANANKAAENVDGRVTALEGKASQTYENYDAIVASGETNKDKIYIDGATNTSYRWNGEKYVSIGGGGNVASNSFNYNEALCQDEDLATDYDNWTVGLLNHDGTITMGWSGHTSEFVEVVPAGTIIRFVGGKNYNTNRPNILGYDKDKNVLRKLLSGGSPEGGIREIFVYIPFDVHFIRISSTSKSIECSKISIEKITTQHIVENHLTIKNYYDPQLKTPSHTGSDFGLYGGTDYIPVVEGMTIVTNASGFQSAGGVCTYTSDKTFIEDLPQFYNTIFYNGTKTFTKEDIDNGVAFIRAGFYNATQRYNLEPYMFIFYDGLAMDLPQVGFVIKDYIKNHVRKISKDLVLEPHQTDSIVEGKIVTFTKNGGLVYVNKNYDNSEDFPTRITIVKMRCLEITDGETCYVTPYNTGSKRFGEAKVGETVVAYAFNPAGIGTEITLFGNVYLSVSKASKWEIEDSITFYFSMKSLKMFDNILPHGPNNQYVGYLFQYVDLFNIDKEPFVLADLAFKTERSRKRLLSDFYNEKTYTCFGDSITSGTQGGYATLIADHFGMKLNNLGVSGSAPHGTDPTNGNPGNLRDEQLAKITEDTMVITISGGQNSWKTSEDINSLDRSNSIGAFNYAIDYIREHFPMSVILLCPTRTNQTMYNDYRRIGENKQVPVIPTDDETLIGWERDKLLKLLRYDNIHFTRFGNIRFASLCISEISKLIM